MATFRFAARVRGGFLYATATNLLSGATSEFSRALAVSRAVSQPPSLLPL